MPTAESETKQAFSIPRIVKAEHGVHQNQQEALLVSTDMSPSPMRRKESDTTLLSRLSKRRNSMMRSRANNIYSPVIKSLTEEVEKFKEAKFGTRLQQLKFEKNKQTLKKKKQESPDKN